MDQLIEQLLDVLLQTHTLYQQMLPVIESEKAAAVASEFDQLISHTIEKERLLDQLKRIERRREDLLTQIAAALPALAGPITLSNLADHLGEPFAPRLRKAQEDLRQVIDAVRDLNAKSRMLFTHCQQWAGNTLRFFRQCMGDTDVYSAKGNLRTGAGGGRLVSGNV